MNIIEYGDQGLRGVLFTPQGKSSGLGEVLTKSKRSLVWVNEEGDDECALWL